MYNFVLVVYNEVTLLLNDGVFVAGEKTSGCCVGFRKDTKQTWSIRESRFAN